MNKLIILIILTVIISCKHRIEREITNYQYYDVSVSDTIDNSVLYAITDDEYLQYGARVAYITINGDTIIPFG